MNTDRETDAGKGFLTDFWTSASDNAPELVRGFKLLILAAGGYRMISVMQAVSESPLLAWLSLIFSEGGVIVWDFVMHYSFSDPAKDSGRNQRRTATLMHWIHIAMSVIFSFIDILRIGTGIKVGDLTLVNNYDAVSIIAGGIIGVMIMDLVAVSIWVANDPLIAARSRERRAAAKADIARQEAIAEVREANAPLLARARGQLEAIDELRRQFPNAPESFFAHILRNFDEPARGPVAASIPAEPIARPYTPRIPAKKVSQKALPPVSPLEEPHSDSPASDLFPGEGAELRNTSGEGPEVPFTQDP